jgi:hypothetical protein
MCISLTIVMNERVFLWLDDYKMKSSFRAPPNANASINDAVDGVLSWWTSSRTSASSHSSPIFDRSDVRVFSTLEKTLSGSTVVTGRTARIRSRGNIFGNTTCEQFAVRWLLLTSEKRPRSTRSTAASTSHILPIIGIQEHCVFLECWNNVRPSWSSKETWHESA